MSANRGELISDGAPEPSGFLLGAVLPDVPAGSRLASLSCTPLVWL
ncbi:MAG: hypothetical protein V1895_03250 [Parcubacteria group bacterium]